MMGGEEAPCVPLENIRVIQAKDPAAFCPRVELHPRNRIAAELALAGARFGTEHALWSKLFDVRTAGWAPRRRSAMLYRVLGALSSDEVAARIKRARDKAANEAAPKRRARRR